jgi:indoleamine 2,3-dioxygenase
MQAVNLEDYDIHPERGFLPDLDPLDRLPADFQPWEAEAHELPKLLVSGKVRSFLQQLPLVDAADLSEDRQRRRAMVILSFLGHAYVWGEQEPVSSIPSCLAVPWQQVAESLGRPPVLSYVSYALDNWRRLDPNRPIEPGNIVLSQNFLGGLDEEWFVLIHVAIEAKAGPALAAIVAAQQAVAEENPEAATDELATIAATVDGMHEILLRMPERCDPYIYYHRVRPYLHGWANHPMLPSGIVYEGVTAYGERPQMFRGETGAQSSIVPALDGALGIAHAEDLLRTYLQEMRDYMPPKHRAFIEAIEGGPSIRDLVLGYRDRFPRLRESYNAAVDGIAQFRTTHLEYAHNYIIKQSAGGPHNPRDLGTGGTPLVAYLSKHREETRAHRID